MTKYKSSLFPENKKGWIRIVEAFVAILLIAGIVLVILDKGYIAKEDPSEKIYTFETGILKEIQENETLRQAVLSAPEPLPINSSNVNFPAPLNWKINPEIPSYLGCESLICDISDDCILDKQLEKDVYVRSVIISSTLVEYKPRQLKLFCWLKNN